MLFDSYERVTNGVTTRFFFKDDNEPSPQSKKKSF